MSSFQKKVPHFDALCVFPTKRRTKPSTCHTAKTIKPNVECVNSSCFVILQWESSVDLRHPVLGHQGVASASTKWAFWTLQMKVHIHCQQWPKVKHLQWNEFTWQCDKCILRHRLMLQWSCTMVKCSTAWTVLRKPLSKLIWVWERLFSPNNELFNCVMLVL